MPTLPTLSHSTAYFVQGVKLQLATLAESYLLKDELKLNPAAVSLVFSIAHLPWILKPLYGMVSDAHPLPFPGSARRERRRPYLVLCGLGGAAAFALLALSPPSRNLALACMTAGELAIAFSDVVIDALVVERARGEPQATSGALQSLSWGAQAVGSLSSAWTAGALIQAVGPRPVLGLMAAFPLLIAAAALWVDEGRLTKPSRSRSLEGGSGDSDSPSAASPSRGSALRPSLTTQARSLLAAVATPTTQAPALFILGYHASPHAGTALFYFYNNELAFTPEFIGRIALLDGVAQLAGVALFNARLKSVPLASIFTWVVWLGAGASATQLLLVTRLNQTLGIPDKAFAAVDSVLLTALGRVALMPVLVLAARLCPTGVEASLYAMLMSLSNLGSGVGDALGAALTAALGVTAHRFDGLPALVAICAVGRLAPLLLLPLVRGVGGE